MTRKIIGYYSDTLNEPETGRLTLEIGQRQLACMVRKPGQKTPDGFELFDIEDEDMEPADLFSSIQSGSRILTRGYPNTRCYYNTPEALIMPAAKFSPAAAEDFLSLVFGESQEADTRHDRLPGDLVTIYRVPKSLHELVGRNFVLYQPHHSFSGLLEQVIARKDLPSHYLKLQFYAHHFILLYMKQGQLQLIRSFSYQSPQDVLYHLSNMAQQFHIPAAEALIEVSGMLEADGISQKQLHALFGHVQFDSIAGDEAFLSATALYPAYYFTPAYNLPA
ncbi:MAG: DUF3822 family protein [Chitinophagaceae bacterium]|nr:DUF3822 family protein [Chitinophagaceae bacterium]